MELYGFSLFGPLCGILFLLHITAADRALVSLPSHNMINGSSALNYNATHLSSKSTLLEGTQTVTSSTLQRNYENTLRTAVNNLESDSRQENVLTQRTLSDEESATKSNLLHESVTTSQAETLTETSRQSTRAILQRTETLTTRGPRLDARTTPATDTLTEAGDGLVTRPKADFEPLTEAETVAPQRQTTPASDSLTEAEPNLLTGTGTTPSALTETQTRPATETATSLDLLTTAFRQTELTQAATTAQSVTESETSESVTMRNADLRIPVLSDQTLPPVTQDYTTSVDKNNIHDKPEARVTPVNMVISSITEQTPSPPPPAEDDVTTSDEIDVAELRTALPETEKSDVSSMVAMPVLPARTTPAPGEESEAEQGTRLPDSQGVSETGREEEEEEREGTTTQKVAGVISVTTDGVTISTTTTGEDMVTTGNMVTGTPETLDETDVGFFRCRDGTLIGLESLCDHKGDCPDFSDEDMCEAEEKANITKSIIKPSSQWTDLSSPKAEGDTLISLDGPSQVIQEIEVNKTKKPDMFECLEGGGSVPWNAVCDKKADCEDYSDEYDCEGSKHVTTQAMTTTEATTPEWRVNEKKTRRPTIEIMNEDEDELVEFFRCLDGSAIIPMKAVCDKKWDCLDFSDEDECDAKGKLNMSTKAKTRPSMSWATQAPKDVLPQKEDQVIVEAVSEAKGSLLEFWRCENGNIIHRSSVCDKKDDCGDFSDEDDCAGGRKVPTTEAPPTTIATTTNSSQSESGTLAVTTMLPTTVQTTVASLTVFQSDQVQKWTLPDRQDENDKIPVAMFTCADGEQIEATKVCDREVDCFDGTDEDDCYDGWNEPRMRVARETEGSGVGPVDECAENPNICTMRNEVCVDTLNGYNCVCGNGTVRHLDRCVLTQTLSGSLIINSIDGVPVTFTPELNDPTSPEYKALAATVCSLLSSAITAAIAIDPNFLNCNVTSFKAGTITANYDLTVCAESPEETSALIDQIYDFTANGLSELQGTDGTTYSVSVEYPGQCPFPTLSDRVILGAGSPAQLQYQNGTTITLDCTLGSSFVGTPTTTCVDGAFTVDASCLRNCHIDPLRNALTCTSDTYLHNTSPDCSCTTGYNLEIPTTQILCNDALFIPSHPQCEETNECMLPVSPCDDNANCFNMPLGSFTCECFPGYTGDGVTCEDIDECTLGLDLCDPDALCTNTPGSYICTCFQGFIGDGITSCVEPIYFDYGTSFGDLDIKTSAGVSEIDGYTTSQALERRRLFPVGNSLYRYIMITNTGTVVFSNTLSVDLSEFSHPSRFNSTSGLPAVSVFGIEAQISSTDSNIYYQVYDDTDMDSRTTSLLAAVSARVNDADPADTGITSVYTAKWALVVTWVNQRRFGTFMTSSETNTFQAVFTTDGVYGFALLLFQELEMLWDQGQLTLEEIPIIGFRTNVQNYDLQTTEGYIRAQMFRPDELTGNVLQSGNRQMGQWVYRLDANADTFINPAEFCQSWFDQSQAVTDSMDILPCPCTRLQAVNDKRFRSCALYSDGSNLPNVDPYPASLNSNGQCVQQLLPSMSGGGSRCVYWRNESLVVGYNSLWESSHIQKVLVGPTDTNDEYVQWANEDVLPRYYCCSQSTDPYFCNLYEMQRPIRTCSDYQAVGVCHGEGDPHITTLDDFQYTFNGLGEFILVRVTTNSFELQGRAERALDGTGAVVDTGTVYTGFAAEHRTKVEFTLNAARTVLSILVNGTESVTPSFLQSAPYVSSDPLFSLRVDDTGNGNNGVRYLASWKEAANSDVYYSISVGFQLKMLDFSFQAPPQYRDGRTDGLYGKWNGDMNDDIVSPDGFVTPNPSILTEEQLFTLGNLWRTTSSSSLFTYQGANTWSTYNPSTYTPSFLTLLMALAEPSFLVMVQDSCGTDQSCQFDALATNDVSIGTNTMEIVQTRTQEANDLANFPPMLRNITEISPDSQNPGIGANGILNVIVGQSYTFQASASDPNGDVIEYSLQGQIPTEASIDSTTGILTWTPASLGTVEMGILASDGTVSSFLQLMIVVCSCANGGTCVFDAYMEGSDINNNNFAVAQCDCTTGWSGADCSSDFDSCLLDPCYPGVTCIDLPPPSLTPSCQDCPPNLTGDGFQCWDLDECVADIDGCRQICTNTVGSFMCSCFIGYELTPNNKDCLDIDECDRATDECDVNADCSNTLGSYDCNCNQGYSLHTDNRTCIDIDECSTGSPCDINADCGNVVGSFMCQCRSGYQGDGRTCEDINECFNPDLNDCSPLATCTNTDGYFVCTCNTGYEGNGLNCTDRDECTEGVAQCNVNAICMNTPGSFSCGCTDGYMGDGNTCVDVNECLSSDTNNCDSNADCLNLPGTFSCTCKNGFTGNGTVCEDVDECTAGTSPCSPLATCTNTVGSFVCTCNSGYNGNGTFCADINECEQQTDDCSQRCVNQVPGYTCACDPGFILNADNRTCDVAVAQACDPNLDPCTGGAVCSNATGAINCTCLRGYSSTNATHCQDIDECVEMTDNCDMSVGICSNTPGGYVCSCQPGYFLESDQRTCSDINECLTGADNCDANAQCSNIRGSFVCTCNVGYSGNGVTCSNIDECLTNPCVNNSDCTDTVGSFMCMCSAGYVGDQVGGCTDFNECSDVNICDENADCTNLPGSYMCTCKAGFEGGGVVCTDIQECATPNRCPANSDCVELEGSYTCVCQSGYRGDGTEPCEDINECQDNPEVCHIKADCTNTNGSYTCACMIGYLGDGVNCTDINECDDVSSIDCDVNSRCMNTEGSYTCFCNEGYFDATGGRAEAGSCEDIDECALGVDNCDVNGFCVNTNGSFDCQCNSGYMLNSDGFSCSDIKECSQVPNPCDVEINRVCIELEGSYLCVCQASSYLVNGVCVVAHTIFMTVDFVDIDGLVVEFYYDAVNTEAGREGLANDTFVLLRNTATFADVLEVTVFSMIRLADIRVAQVVFRVDIPITNQASEEQLYNTFNAGLTGTRMDILEPDNRVYVDTFPEVDENECSNMTICPANSMCINTIGSYLCTCDAGYEPDTNNDCTDVNECQLGRCSVNAACNNSIGSFTCVCNTGYSGNGLTCTDIDECLVGGACGVNTECTNNEGSYSCACLSGYTGDPCADIDECSDPSLCSGMNEDCVNLPGSYRCRCVSGTIRFKGFCLVSERLLGRIRYNRISGVPVDFTPALADPTSDGYSNMSSIVCSVFASQIDLWLNLDVPYDYLDCNITGFAPGSIIATFSIDIFAEDRPEALRRATMVYDMGFTGDTEEWTGTDGTTLYLDDLEFEEPANVSCDANPCLNNGTCLIDYDDATTRCECAPGYNGSICEIKAACLSFQCLNGGECLVDSNGDAYCRCPAEYYGTFCELLTACLTVNCENNGTCVLNLDGDAVCSCPDGFSGPRCEDVISSGGLPVGTIVGIVLGVVAFVLLIILACFCCLVVVAARRRRRQKRDLFEGEDNMAYRGRRVYGQPSPILGLSSGAVVRNDLDEFSRSYQVPGPSNFHYYQNLRGRSLANLAPRPMFDDDDDDDETIDSRFSGIVKNMWNMHAERQDTSFDPREIPSTSNFLAGGIPRATVQARTTYPDLPTNEFSRPYVADGNESRTYSDETEEFRPYRGRNAREKSRGLQPYSYF